MVDGFPLAITCMIHSTSSYIINFLVESNGCGKSTADLLCNFILLGNVIHHVMDIIHISRGENKLLLLYCKKKYSFLAFLCFLFLPVTFTYTVC